MDQKMMGKRTINLYNVILVLEVETRICRKS